jgi:hypothetical protein
MESQGGLNQKEIQSSLAYALQSILTLASQNQPQHEHDSPHYSPPPIQNPFIKFILEEKVKSLRALLENVHGETQSTSSLGAALLSYLDAELTKVENHLLQIDFWQDHQLHPDVMPLRTQMQQQLFQLEQEKVRTRVQINSQLIQLSRELRSTLKELNEIQLQSRLFTS